MLQNFSLASIDSYDYDKDRIEVNQMHSQMNHIVSEINKRQKQKEKEEREKREKEEREKKEQEEKMKKE